METDESERKNYFDQKYPAILITVLILLSVISTSLSTLPNLSKSTQLAIYYFDYSTLIIFTIEYISRIYTAKDKKGYVFSFYGVIDFLAILPFFISIFIDLRALRILRIFRFIRIFKLARYSDALKRISDAIIKAKEELIISIIALCMLIYFAAYGVYVFEHEVQPKVFASIFDAIWWSIVTITTVGYGDIYPITVGGKIFTFFMMIIGLGLVAVPTGIFATALFRIKDEK